jgi:hypothetical protein
MIKPQDAILSAMARKISGLSAAKAKQSLYAVWEMERAAAPATLT